MPDMVTAHIDRALTNMSVAYLQDERNFIADKVFPTIPVKRQTDVFYKYDKGDFFRDEAEERARLSESVGGDYSVSTDLYHARKYSFHKDVAPEDRANYDEPLNADIDAQIYVSGKMGLKREIVWAQNYFTTGVWGTEYTGAATTAGTNLQYWNSDSSDPIADITNAGVNMAGLTGYRPNTMVVSPRVFNALKNHFDILDRIKYTEKGIVSEELLASLFGVDNFYVAWGVVNSARKGATDDVDFISGNSALLCYSNPRPSLRSPSAGYTFAWTGLEGAGGFGNRISRIPMDLLGIGVERIEGDIAFDSKVVSEDLGVFFSGMINPA